MNPVALSLVMLNFAVFGLLALFFFRRRGGLNARWWVTAAPFFVAPALALAAAAGVLPPVTDRLQLAAIPLALASIGLMLAALHAHRVRVALWHQPHDAPEELVTRGPYRWVRHPFYVAYALALAAVVVLYPHPGTGAVLGWGLAALSLTAAREERRLRASRFGAAYAVYQRATGRFWPRLRRP
ncbi:MAG TPA: isoprenylcysteine carboxylmethyltransferase family protein [Gemmatimonadales bacterium]|nr:isoprenylcysteine carboxylmethyltransferase family protein [Gemmatimonadales bacterium]